LIVNLPIGGVKGGVEDGDRRFFTETDNRSGEVGGEGETSGRWDKATSPRHIREMRKVARMVWEVGDVVYRDRARA
jgi:hypothetical protein